MSLLLDARKKARGSGDGHPELSLSPVSQHPTAKDSASLESARNASQNLFKAKADTVVGGQVNRKLLYALLGAVVLFGLGAGYVWYEISALERPAARPVARTAAVTTAPPTLPDQPVTTPAKPVNSTPAVTAVAAPTAPQAEAAPVETATAVAPAPRKPTATVQVRRSTNAERDTKSDTLDALLNSAYQAYRAGKFDQAQGLYRDALNQDGRNVDALLGLAAIAQHRGADTLATQYYGKVLALDPRNAVANAGMSALTTDENRESRLKMLLNEQQDSPSLLFALGNQYAEQARWSEAQQAYFNAYKLEPNNAMLAFNLAISLERLGQPKSAVQYYQRALSLDTGNSAGFDHAAIEKRVKQLAP